MYKPRYKLGKTVTLLRVKDGQQYTLRILILLLVYRSSWQIYNCYAAYMFDGAQ